MISAPPRPSIWSRMQRDFIAQVLPILRDAPEVITPTSWHRTAEANREEHGDEFSQHLVGLALDITGASADTRRRLARSGIVVVVEFDHVHLQMLPARQLRRWAERYGAWILTA